MGSSVSSRHDITLQMDNDKFHSGDKLRGYVHLPKGIRENRTKIDIVFWGEAVHTSEQSTIRDCDGNVYHTVVFFQSTDSIDIEQNCSESDAHRFEIDLPIDLPPSFVGPFHYPAVRYWLHATVKSMGKLYGQQTSSVIVVRRLNAPNKSLAKFSVAKEIANMCRAHFFFDSQAIRAGDHLEISYDVRLLGGTRMARGFLCLNRLIGVAIQENVARVTYCQLQLPSASDLESQLDSQCMSGRVLLRTPNDCIDMPSSFDGNVGETEFVHVYVKYEVIIVLDLKSTDEDGEKTLCLCQPMLVYHD